MRLLRPLAANLFLLAAALPLCGQDSAPPNGPRRVETGWHAIVGARAIVAPGRTVENATIVIRDGRIESIASGAEPPAGARVHPAHGLTVHAAWIDAHVALEAPRPAGDGSGAHWHVAVTPSRDASAALDEKLARTLRELGFGTAAVFPKDGIVRGRGNIVTLEALTHEARRRILRGYPTVELAFEQQGRGEYPSSRMGAVAMVRQTLFDATHALARPAEANPALLDLAGSTQYLFATTDELDLLRAARTMAECAPNKRTLFLGSGTEFRRVEAIAATKGAIILPLAFPDAPDVTSLGARESVALRQLSTWELAPTNPARLRRAGVSFALTSDRLDDRADFLTNLRSAIRHGLSPDDALAALTTTPAWMLGIEKEVGTLEPGRLANLCVVSGDPFGDDRRHTTMWIGGVPHVLSDPALDRLLGPWTTTLRIGDVAVALLELGRSKGHESLTIEVKGSGPGTTIKASDVRATATSLDFALDLKELGVEGRTTLSAVVVDGRIEGTGTAPDGTRLTWTAVYADAPLKPTAPTDEVAARELDAARARTDRALPVPLGAFGRIAEPRPQRVAILGATIWTAGPQGTIEDGALFVDGGKVRYVGPQDDAPPFDPELVIQIAGIHVTPGLIDCHSHTGITGGVNEGTQAVTAEVRIGDVLDPDDVDWYRQLAGGVTCVNQLHGSANPIGGQSQTTKLRWGVHDPERMKFEGSRPGIKFALGENVKRSRSQDNGRYPNTRMGVDAIIRDRFTAAREYGAVWGRAQHELLSSIPRRDLELEALWEILQGERLLHCHSYRQDEILALCRVADEFGFTIGTFQHGLEGYKIAEAIRDHAIGASIFSDWWAYKYEVVDAIPENAAIMTRVGVTVSMNSDSDELARRLNTEAAKAIKYGGLSPTEALALVTINPARQLGIEKRVGSLEAGKDADFAIWNGDPLSYFSRCEQTWIEGARQWSRDEDAAAREVAESERVRLVQRVLIDAGGGRAGAEDHGENDHHSAGECGCDDVHDHGTEGGR